MLEPFETIRVTRNEKRVKSTSPNQKLTTETIQNNKLKTETEMTALNNQWLQRNLRKTDLNKTSSIPYTDIKLQIYVRLKLFGNSFSERNAVIKKLTKRKLINQFIVYCAFKIVKELDFRVLFEFRCSFTIFAQLFIHCISLSMRLDLSFLVCFCSDCNVDFCFLVLRMTEKEKGTQSQRPAPITSSLRMDFRRLMNPELYGPRPTRITPGSKIGTALFLIAGSYILYTNWNYAGDKEQKEKLQAEREAQRQAQLRREAEAELDRLEASKSSSNVSSTSRGAS